jgi:DNA topoisomerase-1
MTKMERLSETNKAFKWWEAPELPKGLHWRKLEHAGIAFPPPYVPHGVAFHYDGKKVELTPPQEELASFFAGFPKDGPHLAGDPQVGAAGQRSSI